MQHFLFHRCKFILFKIGGTIAMTVYENIKKYAKKRNMNLQDVALKAGLSKNMIYQYNKGKNPSLETLTKIAEILGVSYNDLAGDNSTINIKSKKIDIKDAMQDDYTVMSYGGREIPPEELEMIRRILDGGK